MILIITHSKDNDGHLSGAICQFFEERLMGTPRDQIQYLRWSYGDKVPSFEFLQSFSKIYLLDLTFYKEKEIMEFLSNDYKGSVVWIDHHQANYDYSIIPEYIHNRIPGVRDHSYSACINTWNWWLNFMSDDIRKKVFDYNYFVWNSFPSIGISNLVFPEEESIKFTYPYWLYLSGCYDIWKWNGTDFWNNFIIPFEYYLRSESSGPDAALNTIEDYFSRMELNNIPDIRVQLLIGSSVYRYQEKKNISVLGNLYKYSVLNEFTGKKVNCLVINTESRGSMIFQGISQELKDWTDYYILWSCTGKKYKYSAYSEKENILVPDLIIKGAKFSGHPHAGGCVINKKLL